MSDSNSENIRLRQAGGEKTDGGDNDRGFPEPPWDLEYRKQQMQTRSQVMGDTNVKRIKCNNDLCAGGDVSQ